MKLTLTINSSEVVLEGTPNEMIEVIEHLNNKQKVKDDKFEDWSDWDAVAGWGMRSGVLMNLGWVWMTMRRAVHVPAAGLWPRTLIII